MATLHTSESGPPGLFSASILAAASKLAFWSCSISCPASAASLRPSLCCCEAYAAAALQEEVCAQPIQAKCSAHKQLPTHSTVRRTNRGETVLTGHFPFDTRKQPCCRPKRLFGRNTALCHVRPIDNLCLLSLEWSDRVNRVTS